MMNYEKSIANRIPIRPHLAFTCSKLAIETLEKVVKYAQR